MESLQLHIGRTGVICVLLLLKACMTHAVLHWETDSVTVKQGDSVNVTCNATDLEFFSVLRIVLRTRDGIERAITDDTNLKPPFAQLPRYSVASSYEKKVGKLTITYRGVQSEDDGTLVCIQLGSDLQPAELRLRVLAPVNDVYVISVAGDGSAVRVNTTHDIVHLREAIMEGVGCVAVTTTSWLIPKLSVTVDGVNEALYFFPSNASHKLPQRLESIVEPVIVSYQLTYVSMKPDRRFNDRFLTCTAVSEGYPPVSVKALIHVEYAPAISCPAYEHYAKSSDTLTITCFVEANPRASITWMSGNNSPLVNNTHIMLVETAVSNDRTKVQLIIQSVIRADFGSYYLVAGNELGTAEVPLFLHAAFDFNNPELPSAEEQQQMQQFKALMGMLQSSSNRPTAAVTSPLVAMFAFAVQFNVLFPKSH